MKLIYKYDPDEPLIVVFTSTRRFKYVMTKEVDYLFDVLGTPAVKYKDLTRLTAVPDTLIRLLDFKFKYNTFGVVTHV